MPVSRINASNSNESMVSFDVGCGEVVHSKLDKKVIDIASNLLVSYIETRNQLAMKRDAKLDEESIFESFKHTKVFKEFKKSEKGDISKNFQDKFNRFLNEKIDKYSEIVTTEGKIPFAKSASVLMFISAGWLSEKINKSISKPIESMISKLISGFFYPIRGQKKGPMASEAEEAVAKSAPIPYSISKIPPYKKMMINVDLGNKSRQLEAWYNEPPKGIERKDTTVVLFHDNGMGGAQMYKTANYYLSQGYNVLLPTMGGYPGSPGVVTSEASTYQDVEAVKFFLRDTLKAENVAYHGTSIGASLAFQAAANENSSVQMTPKFVVADKAFTNAVDVAGNIINNNGMGSFKELVKGAVRKGLSSTSDIQLPGGKIVSSDGLNNIYKAKELGRRGIPLIVLEGKQDEFMGRDPVVNGVEKRFKNNFGSDLFAAYSGARRLKPNEGDIDLQHIVVDSWTHEDHVTLNSTDVNSRLESGIGGVL